jgi:hypothetical protein
MFNTYCYLRFCHLIYPDGMMDFAFISTNSDFVGIPFSYLASFFAETVVMHRNILLYVTEQQTNLFI